MQLILDEYGISLDKSDNMFSITQGQQHRSISPTKVSAIHIFKTATLSTAALLMAAENEIPVLIYDSRYKPAVRLWNSNFTSTGMVRVMQPLFCKSSQGLHWCKKLLSLKLNGQLQNIAYTGNRWPSIKDICLAVSAQINNSLQQLESMPNEPTSLPSLRGIEGVSTSAYWKLLQTLLDTEIFKKREQQQPSDRFNPAINYLYGILYGKVEGALLAYGLDPMVGIIHVEGYSKKSLVYDCIEPFRPWAELLLLQLFKNRTLQTAHFEYREEEVTLGKEARVVLATEFIKMLEEKTLMNNRRITRNDQVFHLCSQLSQAVKNFDPEK